MSISTLIGTSPPPAGLDLKPVYLEPELVVTPEDNPSYSPVMLAALLDSVQAFGQLVPGFVAPQQDGKFLCIEGNRRLAVARQLQRQFWCFNLGRDVPEVERIRLGMHHHASRRHLSRAEIAQKAARYMELTGCTADTASAQLNVSPATLSRAFGDSRIPVDLRLRADAVGLYIKSLIATLPKDKMEHSLAFAESLRPDGRKRTRDEVVAFNRELKKGGRPPPPTVCMLQAENLADPAEHFPATPMHQPFARQKCPPAVVNARAARQRLQGVFPDARLCGPADPREGERLFPNGPRPFRASLAAEFRHSMWPYRVRGSFLLMLFVTSYGDQARNRLLADNASSPTLAPGQESAVP